MLHKIFSQKLMISAIVLSLMFTSFIIAGDHDKHNSSKKDIVTIAVESGNFNTLAKALTTKGVTRCYTKSSHRS